MENFKQQSYYGENFNIQFKEYLGNDYSKVAFVFPGQGSSSPGMFKNEMKKLPLCLQIFARADKWAESKNIGKISWFIWSPHLIEKHHFSIIQNLALYTLEVGLFESLQSVSKVPEVVTAHSFGEYAALVSIGAIDFLEMLEIVFQREIFSPAPNTLGSMLALSCEKEFFDRLSCPVKYILANENSYQQVVISFELSDKFELIQYLKNHKIPFKELESVARPYHSHLMQQTANNLIQWLEEYNFSLNPLTANFISSVNNKYYKQGHLFSKSDFIYLVSQQLVKPVLFIDQIKKVIELGIFSFLEIGLSGIYSDFIRNISSRSSKNDFSIQTLSALLNSGSVKSKTSDQLRYNLEKSPFFKIISKYISHITGYDLIEIGIDDHFQEDLRIDSIKKAEIVFKTLQETNTHIEESLSLAKMRSVGEVVEFLEKMQLAPVYKKKKLAQKDSGKLFIPLIPKYHSSPQSNNVLPYNYKNFLKIILNKDVIKYSNKISQFYYDLEIDFKCIVFEIDPNMSTEVSYFLELTRQLQIILNPLKKNISQLKIILLSSADTIIFQSFTAFFKSISKEFGLMFKSILHDFSTLQDQQIEQIMNYEFHDLFSIDIRYEKSKRQTLTWIPLDAALETEKNSSQKRKKIIIIGGSKGLAFEIFTRIKKRENIELVIWGRSSKDDLAIQVNLNRLKKLFSKVHYLQVNALLENDFTDALLQSKKLLEKIDLVINSAGVEYSRLFIEKTATEIEQEACTKILISEILQRHNTNKEFDILHFSSIVGAFGNDGQSIYAYGNAYQSKLPDCLSILWPGLNQVGMTENLGILHKLKSSGINLLEIKDAAIWFESILNADFWGNHDKAKFSGAIAYMDPKDIFLMEFFIRDLKKLESINGDIISPADLLFQKIYNSRTDNYLIDHVIENTSIVPASIAMAAILSFGHLYYKKFPDLIDFEIKNIMMLVDSNDVTCYSHFALTKEKINNQKFLKTVILMTSQVEHFVGSILCNVDSQKNYPNRLEQEYNLQVDLTTFYSKECIAFGPKFQVFSEILFNDKLLESAVLGIGPTKSIYYTGLDTIDSLISIIESAFQAVTVYALILGKGLVIPLRFSRLEIFELKFKKYFIVPSVIEINKNNDHLPFVANVVIYNEKNEAILNINHIEMSVIRHHNALPFKFNDCSRHI